MKTLLQVKVRQYIYGIFAAASPIVVYRGIIDIQEAGLWLIFVGAVLGLTNILALANINKPGAHEAE